MLYGLAITGETPDAKRKALDAALAQLRADLLGPPTAATQNFFNQQGRFVLCVKPGPVDAATAERFKR